MDLLGACQRALRRPVIQGSMGTKKWSLTTARVLNRLRKVSNEILDGQPTEYERACVNRVWPFVGVERREYPANGLWENIKPQDRRDGVRRQLKTRFSEGAFAREGKVARDAFTRADLLAWGDQLLAEDAANAAVGDAELEEEIMERLEDYAARGGDLDAISKWLAITERANYPDHPEVAITLDNLATMQRSLGDHAKKPDMLVHMLPILEQTYGRDHATVDITRKKIVELEKEHGLGHSNVGSALENVTNADLMREDTGTYTCSDSVENVSKFSWKSRSRDGSSRGGERRSCLRSGPASLDQFGMELDSESLLSEVLSMMSL